ncbi:hypothetical protein CDAR_22101 [Caerostris darwini]|uniref:Uncharacterized protein n=1 Tax=Caerostris darwini TaxID=1538125 RepID=A0AAV4PCH0_9ARAC|nr:hypothetical protein CDAR_22101 [Caerostris darwini]
MKIFLILCDNSCLVESEKSHLNFPTNNGTAKDRRRLHANQYIPHSKSYYPIRRLIVPQRLGAERISQEPGNTSTCNRTDLAGTRKRIRHSSFFSKDNSPPSAIKHLTDARKKRRLRPISGRISGSRSNLDYLLARALTESDAVRLRPSASWGFPFFSVGEILSLRGIVWRREKVEICFSFRLPLRWKDLH